MGREKGTFDFAASLEPQIEGPLDRRGSVTAYRDLTTRETWDKGKGIWVYAGLTVAVTDDPDPALNGLYVLRDKTKWNLTKYWQRVGSDGSGGGQVAMEGVPVYTTDEEPPNLEAIWVTENDHPLPAETGILGVVLSRLDETVKRVQELEYALQMKLDAGGFQDSVVLRNSQGTASEPAGEWTIPEADDEQEPEGMESTVAHICVKRGTESQRKRYTPLDGEMAFTTDTKLLYIGLDGKFELISGKGTGGDPDPEEPSDVMDYIDLKVEGAQQIYRVKVDKNGVLNIYDRRVDTESCPAPTTEEKGKECLKGLTISMVYAGGEDANGSSYQPVSHSFIELHNNLLSGADVNLNGMSLQYSNDNGVNWQVFPLKGIVPYLHSFTVRCAPCSDVRANTTRVIVDDFDMEWPGLRISNTKFKLLLTIGTTKCLKENPMTKGIESVVFTDGYVDLVGAQSASVATGNSIDGFESFAFKGITPTRGMRRGYLAEFNKTDPQKRLVGGDTNNNLTDFVPVDFSTDVDVRDTAMVYKPRSTKSGAKDVYYNKTDFDASQPNMVTMTFGRNVNTTRCFNWISVGYYDEFLEYKLAGAANWSTVESINVKPITEANLHLAVHNRQRMVSENGTRFTVHKVILNNLAATPGTEQVYEYRVGREGCRSDVYSFKLKYFDASTPFNFLHVTDQQGWAWEEYEPWRLTMNAIAKREITGEKDFDFIVNTGDMTQNGNRANEWLDYYHAAKDYLPYYPQMCTIGNNDLGPEPGDQKGKTNPALFTAFYCYEYDAKNIPFLPVTTAWDRTNPKLIDKYLMRSVYSFDIGNTHFCVLNGQNYVEEAGDWDSQESWFRADMESSKKNPAIKWRVVMVHDCPFSVVTDAEQKRTCRLNRDNANEFESDATYSPERKYRWSRLFEEYKVDLVLGGHKHTYARSKPLKEKVVEGLVVPNEPLMDESASANGFTDVTNAQGVVYITNQATGFKLSSNKELPGAQAVNPWCAKYFPVVNGKVNPGQYQPTYITWWVSPAVAAVKDCIQMYSYQVTGTMLLDTKTQLYSIYDMYAPPLESGVKVQKIDEMKLSKTV